MRKRDLKNMEWGVLIVAIILSIIGIVALFSATQETEYDEWIDGEYIALGNHAYSFAVQYARCTEYGFDGCSTEPFATEGDILPGYFVIEEDTLYYLGQSDDFSNYDDYPACEFYFADELPTS